MKEEAIKVLEATPFGFVLEIQNDRAYYCGYEYELYVNGNSRGCFNENVLSVFGLKPDTDAVIELRPLEKDTEKLTITLRTQALSYLIDVRDYNAAGDGITDDTAAINAAIYTAPKGAVVYLAKGTYIVSQILLKSDVDIYMEEGCVVKRTSDRSSMSVLKGFQRNYDYTDAHVVGSWEGNPLDSYCAVIFGYEAKNVRVYGDGVIDGNGKDGKWWLDAKKKNVAYRPKNIFLNHCEHVTFAGITSQNSAAWNVHPFYSTDLHFYKLHLVSLKNSSNTDGLDPESCVDTEIVGCRFSVGDDCIAIKSGKYFMSTFDYRPTENLYIANCFMADGHGGVVLGSETSCGVRHLRVEKCYMDHTDRGVRIKTRRGRGSGSILDDIRFTNLEMNGVLHGITFNMFYQCDPDGRGEYVQSRSFTEKDKYTPEIKNVYISGIRANDVRGCAIFMYGLPESKIANVVIRDNHFTFAKERVLSKPAMLQNFTLIEDLGLFMKNTDQLTLEDNELVGQYVTRIEEE